MREEEQRKLREEEERKEREEHAKQQRIVDSCTKALVAFIGAEQVKKNLEHQRRLGVIEKQVMPNERMKSCSYDHLIDYL